MLLRRKLKLPRQILYLFVQKLVSVWFHVFLLSTLSGLEELLSLSLILILYS